MFARCTMLALLLGARAVHAQPPTRDDFAYGMELHFKHGHELIEVALPAALYHDVAYADLRDVRVFNGDGHVLPHVLRPMSPLSHSGTFHHAPVFPVYGEPYRDLDTLPMEVRRNAQGRIERIVTPSASGSGPRRIVAYIVDATRMSVPVSALELEWQDSPDEFLASVTVETSDYFARWTPVARDVGIARIRVGNESVENRRIEFPPLRSKFFRLRWPADQPLPALPVIRLQEAVVAPPPPLHWERLEAQGEDAPGEYVFAPQARFPFRIARVRLVPEQNRLVRVTLSSRDGPRDSWVSRAQGAAYRLVLGSATLQSADFVFPGTAAREWRLRLHPIDGLENVAPVVEAAWTPHRLVFTAGGRGPYYLAYGATAAMPPPAPPASRALAEVLSGESRASVVLASAGPVLTFGGRERLEPQGSGWRLGVFAALLLGLAAGGWRIVRRCSVPTKTPSVAQTADR